MLLWLCLILGKYLAANVKKGYSQVGNELLHGAGSSWIVYFSFDFEPICSILEFETLTC